MEGSLTRSEPGIHGLALQCEHPEGTLVHAAQRLAPHEPLQAFDPECELAQGQGTLRGDPSLPKPFEILRCQILRTVDDSEVLETTALRRRLHEPLGPEG